MSALERTRRSAALILLVMIFACAGLAGCGKKDDPMPPDIRLPLSAVNLKVARMDGGVLLSCQMPEAGESMKSLRIQRSAMETLRPDCPECPRNFLVIADLLLKDPALQGETNNMIRFVDAGVTPGWLYTYRVILCNHSGYCSEPSEPAELKY